MVVFFNNWLFFNCILMFLDSLLGLLFGNISRFVLLFLEVGWINFIFFICRLFFLKWWWCLLSCLWWGRRVFFVGGCWFWRMLNVFEMCWCKLGVFVKFLFDKVLWLINVLFFLNGFRFMLFVVFWLMLLWKFGMYFCNFWWVGYG